ncbi:MAG: hypothetical protein K2X82_03250 [Gemmataceae bacterium]|nr:hypothetical protein [Gemmataceae bacterium]
MDLPIPIQVVYAGLGGTLLALIVATATQRWQCKVFFLLALRLAIGWHFLFEGLYKVNGHLAGATDANPRTFSSKPYFDVAPTGFGAYMRNQFGDPQAVIGEKVKAPKDITPEAFDKLTAEQQAAECPPAVAKVLDELEERTANAVRAKAEADLKAVDATEAKATAEAKTDADKAKAKADAEKQRQAARKRVDGYQEAGRELLTAAKARYARWVYGVDARPAKVKFVGGDGPAFTAPQRLDYLRWVREQAAAAGEARGEALSAGLGNGAGTEGKRAAEVRADLLAAEAALAKDADDFVADLVKTDLGLKADDLPAAAKSRGQRMDEATMWFLVAVGGCLMVGLFTRAACLAACGFLVMTYLTHPPFPWYPLPPNTEGNPVFVNKNVIEGLALLALACMPTGRWLGLDALLMPLFGFRKPADA